MNKYIEVPHIGEVLLKEFLEPLSITQNSLAKVIGVPANRINAIVRGLRGITADTDLRLTKYFGLSEGYFLRLQADLDIAKSKKLIGEELSKIVPLKKEEEI